LDKLHVGNVEAFQVALRNTRGFLKHVVFQGIDFTEESFSVVVQGIQESQSVTQMLLNSCIFDEGLTRFPKELFTTLVDKRYSLTMIRGRTFSPTAKIFIGNMLRSNACMSELKLKQLYMFDDTRHTAIVTAVVPALEDDAASVLESLTVCLSVANNWKVLIGSLPQMWHLRKLDISMLPIIPQGCNAMLCFCTHL
jgi:hypothetical protein